MKKENLIKRLIDGNTTAIETVLFGMAVMVASFALIYILHN